MWRFLMLVSRKLGLLLDLFTLDNSPRKKSRHSNLFCKILKNKIVLCRRCVKEVWFEWYHHYRILFTTLKVIATTLVKPLGYSLSKWGIFPLPSSPVQWTVDFLHSHFVSTKSTLLRGEGGSRNRLLQQHTQAFLTLSLPNVTKDKFRPSLQTSFCKILKNK